MICSKLNRLKGYSPDQLVLGHDMILRIKHKVDWELIFQINQTQVNEDNIRKHSNKVNHDYKVGDKVILFNNSE